MLDQCGYLSRQRVIYELGILRLAARIADLEKEGYVFEPVKKGHDYVYMLVSKPKARQLTLV